MWKALASVFPLENTFEVGLVGALPQDSHPQIPSPCTVWAQRTTSWAVERNQHHCLLKLENLVTQFELFTDSAAVPLKILQSLLSLEGILWRVQRGFKEKTIAKINSRTLIMGCNGRNVCPWCECQCERLHNHFPEFSGGFGEMSYGQRIVTCNLNAQQELQQ